MPEATRGRRRRSQFLLLCTACLVTAAAASILALWRAEAESEGAPVAKVAVATAPVDLGLASQILFRSMASGSAFGRIAAVPLTAPDGPRAFSDLDCERLYVAADRGICVSARRGTFSTSYFVSFFDQALRPGPLHPLTGIPSRARLSPDGRTATVTVFEQGDSYLEPGGFSTRTTLFDVGTAAKLADLDDFAIWRDGHPFKAVDFNFWGVTFADDGNRFYATLSTAGTTYLIEGDLRARSARVLRENVECPSLSPDNQRIVYKQRIAPGRWRLHVLDLVTSNDRPLGEARSVDDQAEWLDDATVAYAVRDRTEPSGGALPQRWGPASFAGLLRRPTAGEATNVWTAPIDGGPARLLIPYAYSPVLAGRPSPPA